MKRVELVSTMGTVVSLDLRTAAGSGIIGRAVDAVTDRLRAIDEQFSPWRPDSWVSRLISGELAPSDCPLEVQQVVELAVEVMGLTDGFFSPYWRRRPYGAPGPDPTGLVKGWAAQQTSDLLISHGLPDHVVNAAGDIVVSGRSTPGDPSSRWRIGISDPRDERELAGVVDLDQSSTRWAVATSGPAHLGAHVSDPHTGRFPQSVMSATAVVRLDDMAQGAAVADACATALVAAADRAPLLLEGLTAQGLGVVVIENDGNVCDPQRLFDSPRHR